MDLFGRDRSRQPQGKDEAKRLRQAAEAERSGIFFLQNGRLRPAEVELRRCVELNPGAAVAHGYLGVVLQRLGRLPEARQELEIAVNLAPGDEALRRAHGAILEDLGHPEEAAAQYEAAVSLNPHSAHAHAALGAFLLKRGDAALAKIHLEVALQIEPQDAQTQADLSDACEKLGDLAAAIEAIRKAISIDPGAALDRKLGLLLEEIGNLEAATAALRAAHEGLIGDADTLFALGRVLIKRAKEGEVQQLYDRAMKSDPPNRERYLADQHRLVQEYSGTASGAAPGAGGKGGVQPSIGAPSSRASDGRSVASGILEAIARLEAAIKADPNNSRLHRDLSIEYIRAGRIAEAKEHTRLAEQLRIQRSQG